MSLAEIAYPVFRVGTAKPESIDGVLLFYTHMLNEVTEVETTTYRVLDDKTLPFDTLNRRRLQLKAAGVPLFKLEYAIYFLGDLVKLANSNTWFIDSAGKLFKYRKTTNALLKFHKINKVIPIPTGGSVVEAVDIPTRFKSMFMPEIGQDYIGVLHLGKSRIFYGYFDQLYDNTRRKV